CQQAAPVLVGYDGSDEVQARVEAEADLGRCVVFDEVEPNRSPKRLDSLLQRETFRRPACPHRHPVVWQPRRLSNTKKTAAPAPVGAASATKTTETNASFFIASISYYTRGREVRSESDRHSRRATRGARVGVADR